MRLPRWTVWPAFLVLGVFLVPALPLKRGEKQERAPRGAARAPKHPRVVVLGIDGLDPRILRETLERFPELTTNYRWLVERGGLHELATTTPPQSPVAWSSFITGRDPGGHGVFDFIHRDPMTREPATSTTKDDPVSAIGLPWDGWHLPTGGGAKTNRSGEAFWTILAEHGIPADVWRMPANFPVEKSEGWSFSGMMTPALDSAYGESKIYTSSPQTQARGNRDRIVAVRDYEGVIDTYVTGPGNPYREDGERITAPMRIYLDAQAKQGDAVVGAAVIEVGEKPIVLAPGEWSDFTRVQFQPAPKAQTVVPSIWGEVRFYLRSVTPDFELYCSAVNIDPIEPVSPVSEPKSASAEVARRVGLYYTQGMPEDVMALKDRAISDVEFMAQSDVVHGEGVRLLDFALDRYLSDERGGLLFFYFSGVDLCSHMMWRHSDDAHPAHDATFAAGDSSSWSGREGSTWKDVVTDLYLRMDPIIGRLRETLPADATIVVMSDHGFAPYHRKFSLNTWLVENGYLVLRDGEEKEKPSKDPAFHQVRVHAPARGTEGVVDWTRTRAYGIGFNGLYLNLEGREQDDPGTQANEAGSVEPGPEADALLAELKRKLEAIVDPKNGERVVLRADLARDVYTGERVAEAPDIIVGFNSGYDNSDDSSLGRIPHDVLADNKSGSFNGSHLMAPEVVPGTLLTNGAVLEGRHGLQDLTIELLRRYGIEPRPGMAGHRVLQ